MQHPEPHGRTRNAGFLRGPDVNPGACGHGLADCGFMHQRRAQKSCESTRTCPSWLASSEEARLTLS